MASLALIRADLGTRLRAITTLTVYDRIADSIEEPAAMVGMPAEIAYNVTMRSVYATWQIPIRLYVAKVDAEEAQDILDLYLAASGVYSIKQAVEDTSVAITSGWHGVQVVGARDFGGYTIGDIEYLGCELIAEVLA